MHIPKPAVNKRILLLISGMLWSGAGLFLVISAFTRWSGVLERNQLILVAIIGLVLGLLISLFGFSKIVRKNIGRICQYPDQACVFAFQEWKSYLLIAVMITMGIMLRHLSFLDAWMLTVVYIAIGWALFLSSIGYYRYLLSPGKAK